MVMKINVEVNATVLAWNMYLSNPFLCNILVEGKITTLWPCKDFVQAPSNDVLESGM
jgi:hypothetical protein